MAHNFSLQDASLSRAKRAELAVKEMGQPIFLGVSASTAKGDTFLRMLCACGPSLAYYILLPKG